jgi:G3E family GTPase
VTAANFDIFPVNVLTGFLGSGKTTLLRRLLSSELSGETAVLINEFGEVGIDNLLVAEVAPDTVLLKTGCVCCSIRGELKEAFLGLLSKRQKGVIPPFVRVILETTGLAEPAPILATLLADPVLCHHFRLGLVITVVDCVNAQSQRESFSEWTAQVTAADRLVISKVDLVDQETYAALQDSLAKMNHAASKLLAAEVDTSDLLLLGSGLHSLSPETEARRWVEQTRGGLQGPWPKWPDEMGDAPIHRPLHQEEGMVKSFCLVLEEQLNWIGFGLWLSMLLNRHGADILRVKGILHIAGAEYPIAIHGVQHLVHPPVHLTTWPSQDRTSRIIFIVRNITQEAIERSFKIFCRNLN